MSPPLEALRSAARSGLLPEAGAPLLVACSGGLDSMALVAALARLDRWRVHVATVDHGLRAGSADQAAFVERAAAALGLPVARLRADPARFPRGRGPEAAARSARYELLLRHQARIGAACLLTAHTADDQAETVLMRLLTGAGLRGLAGIPPARGSIRRPWLGVSRAEVRAFAEAHEIAWVEDPTNRDLRFLRNRVRHQVAPALAAAVGPAWATVAARAADNLRVDREALDALLDDWLARHAGGPTRLDLRALQAAPPSLQRSALYRLVGRVAPALRISAAHVRAMQALVGASGGGVRVALPGGWVASRQGAWLQVRAEGPPPPAPGALLRIDGPGAYVWGGWGLQVERLPALPPAPERGSGCLGISGAPPPWQLRRSKRGERFQKLGAPGRKRLSKALIDAKVPRALRPALPVLASEDRLVWAAGIGPAQSARAAPGEPVHRLSLTPSP